MTGGVVRDSGVVDRVDEIPVCSRSECRADAKWNVNWRNPRIHGPERVKVWLACDEHREYLHDYLFSRDFPVMVTPLGQRVERVVESAGDDGVSLLERQE